MNREGQAAVAETGDVDCRFEVDRGLRRPSLDASSSTVPPSVAVNWTTSVVSEPAGSATAMEMARRVPGVDIGRTGGPRRS